MKHTYFRSLCLFNLVTLKRLFNLAKGGNVFKPFGCVALTLPGITPQMKHVQVLDPAHLSLTLSLVLGQGCTFGLGQEA